MRSLMFAVRDLSAEFFFPPFFLRSEVEAKRAFAGILNSENRTGSLGEYGLYSLGSFDDQSGELVSLTQPVFICDGIAVSKPEVRDA